MLRYSLNVAERLSASTPLPTLFHSDPDAFGLLRFFLDLSPEDALRLKQDHFPTVLDQPAEIDKLMKQLSSWASLSSEPSSPTNDNFALDFTMSTLHGMAAVGDKDIENTKEEEEESGKDDDILPDFIRLKRTAPADVSRANKKMRMG